MLLTLEEIIAATDGVPNGIRLYRKVERAVIEKLGEGDAVPVGEILWPAMGEKKVDVDTAWIDEAGPGDKLYDATALAQARQQGYEAARAEHVWRPIGDAPKDGSTILLRGAAIADGYWLQAAYNGNGAWIWPYIHSEPRFWMPLPAEPAQEKS